jgi:hypothetical protein
MTRGHAKCSGDSYSGGRTLIFGVSLLMAQYQYVLFRQLIVEALDFFAAIKSRLTTWQGVMFAVHMAKAKVNRGAVSR